MQMSQYSYNYIYPIIHRHHNTVMKRNCEITKKKKNVRLNQNDIIIIINYIVTNIGTYAL